MTYEAKRIIHRALVEERRKFGERLQGVNRKGNVFKVVKQMVKKNSDVTGGGSVKDKMVKSYWMRN